MAARITELEAVNMMLQAIGEQPVAALNTGLPDAEDAAIKLAAVSKDVQESGWYFNTEYAVSLVLIVGNEIALPNNTLRVELSDESYLTCSICERAQKLYNLTDHTYVFHAPVVVDIVYEIAFTELPYRAAHYIATRASRIYQQESTKSSSLDSGLKLREQEALERLNDAEHSQADANVLRDNISTYRITRRNSYNYGY